MTDAPIADCRLPRRPAPIVLVSLLFLTAVCPAAAAQTARVGVLLPELGRAQSQALKGLNESLKKLGYVERQNLILETRNAKGDRAALPAAAAELVARKVDVIFTTGTRASTVAAAATSTLPIVFVHPGDPGSAGMIKAPHERSANLTGVAAYAMEKVDKRMSLLKELMPELREAHIFFDSNNAFSRANFTAAQSAAKKLAIPVIERGIKSADELKTSFTGMAVAPGAALFHVPDDLVEGESEFIFANARRKKLPSMFNEESWAIAGATAAYGPSYLEMGRRAGAIVGAILSNPKSALAAIERAEKFELIVNYRNANYIGLKLAPQLLKRADKVIR